MEPAGLTQTSRARGQVRVLTARLTPSVSPPPLVQPVCAFGLTLLKLDLVHTAPLSRLCELLLRGGDQGRTGLGYAAAESDGGSGVAFSVLCLALGWEGLSQAASDDGLNGSIAVIVRGENACLTWQFTFITLIIVPLNQ